MKTWLIVGKRVVWYDYMVEAESLEEAKKLWNKNNPVHTITDDAVELVGGWETTATAPVMEHE